MKHIQYKVFTDPGSRKINEDCPGVSESRQSYCFFVADGLGGHGKGEIAAQTAMKAVCGTFSEQGYTDDFFKTAYYRAQELILAEQKTRHAFSEMKTTAVSLVLHDNKAYWAHIGDSRLYIFKHNKVKFRTIDHSVPQMLALSGDIKESEIRKHPDRNRLLRVLGVKGEQPKYELGKTIRLSGIQAFLLCTDGFWELIDEESMEKLLKSSNTPDEWIEKMRKVILENGKNTEMDNFTAIAVFCDKGGWFW